jgi:hypothetical protein
MELHAVHLILLVLAVLAVSFWSYREGVAYGRKLADVPAGTPGTVRPPPGCICDKFSDAPCYVHKFVRWRPPATPNPPPRYPSGNVHERPLTAAYHDQPPETGHPMLCGCPSCR